MIKKSVDIVIIGGGIAGLWTLAKARAQGFNAILLERHQLGGEQTLSSQGIIHGGSKYALAGSISKATNMISDMPNTWRAAINGASDVNLTTIKELSSAQYLVPSSGIDTQLLSFLGSKNMASHTEKITKNALPEAYTQLGIHRSIFRLNEIVLDVNSILKSFMDQYHQYIYQAEVTLANIQASDTRKQYHHIQLTSCVIECQYIVLACGEGNAEFKAHSVAMQTRPLQMVMMKGKTLPAIYAHFIGRSTKPVLTVTSHHDNDKTVWYMGGDLAENGVEKTSNQQIDSARVCLQKILPALSLTNDIEFTTHRINRAEPQQASLTRPDDAFVTVQNNIISGWPTKLALAPRFAEKVLAEITTLPQAQLNDNDLPLPNMSIAAYPWETM